MADRKRSEHPSVRDLARDGKLHAYFAQAPQETRRRLRAEGYELLHPVVFMMRRRIEARRGHRGCMTTISRLRPECLDQFHNDMDAVLDDLFRNARIPIENLEGWVNSRLVRATVDAYRRRRGERGALQRPRVPRWLARELNYDKWLMELSIEMLEWVGVEATAGIQDWPTEAWSARRAAVVGPGEAAEQSLAQDIATVINAMRKRPKWYADYVERPLGYKPPPLAAASWDGSEPARDLSRAVQDAQAADEARLTELASLAVAAIAARIERGDSARTAVVEVISVVFGAGTGSESLDRLPGHDSSDDEVAIASLADPEMVDRIVAVVLGLLAH